MTEAMSTDHDDLMYARAYVLSSLLYAMRKNVVNYHGLSVSNVALDDDCAIHFNYNNKNYTVVVSEDKD